MADMKFKGPNELSSVKADTSWVTKLLFGLLGIAFVVLKLTEFIDWSWWWVTAPFWVPILVPVVITVVIPVFSFIIWAIFIAIPLGLVGLFKAGRWYVKDRNKYKD